MTPPIQRTNSFVMPQQVENPTTDNVQRTRDDSAIEQSHPQLEPQNRPVSPGNAIVQCLKGEKVPSELNLKAPPEGLTAQDQKRAVADAVSKIAAKLAEGVPQQATTLGFAFGEDSYIELRTDGEGGMFLSVDGGKEMKIDAQDLPANLGQRVQADQLAHPDMYSSQTELPAQTKAVVDAFADLISGKKVPSKMTIVDPLTNQASPAMKLDLAKAAVKLSTALMFLPPGEESTMGFSVGDSILEVRRDNFGSFFVSIDGSSEQKVPVDDVKLGLANNLAVDLMTHTDLYGSVDLGVAKKGAKPQELALANLSVIISAANASAKSPLGREIYEKALELKFGLTPDDLKGLGLNGLRQVAMKALEGGYKNVNAAKRNIADIVKNNPLSRLDIINSPEASKEILQIQEILENSPEQVEQKVDISRINVRSRDPQAGMTAEQKKIHNLVADLFMPADSRLYETNQGQGGNRIRQTLLAHKDAVALLVQARLAGQELPLGSLPGNMRAAVQGALNQIADACIEIYRSDRLAQPGQAAPLPDLKDGKVDANRLEAAMRQVKMEVFTQADRALEAAIDTLAKDQQQILNTKLESSIQGIKQAKAEAAQKGNAWDIDIAALYAQKVTAPEGSPERAQQLAGVMKEIFIAVKDLALATRDSLEASEDDKLPYAVQSGTWTKSLFAPLNLILNMSGKVPGSWFSADGKQVFDDCFNNLTNDQMLDYLPAEQIDKMIKALARQPENQPQDGPQYASNFAKECADIFRQAKDLGYDFRPSLAQIANEAEDFDKPGMGMFTKNVLTSYFSGDVKLPPNATPDQIKTAEQINAGRQIDKRSMLAALVRYSTSGVSETAQLGAMLKGGGPLLHKLLQNFNMPGIDPDFRTALEDMKSNLAPIEPAFVQAQLMQIVQNSGGTISNIKIDKALGAASVAQAFLVTVTPSDPNQQPYTAAVKIIRPDVKVRTEREVEHFKLAAEGIPGMKESYLGLYDQYQKEFDLRLEADNIQKGVQVYNDGVNGNRVDTVGLVDGVAPSANAMIMKLAPGQSMDVYFANMKVKLEELRSKTPTTFAELLEYKKELRAMYQELHDVNKSLGAVANKWLNKAIFSEQGFFHGDLHAGNMMVQPKDPNDPQSVSKVTMIDFGNATSLDKKQTDAIFKVNVACVFGGVYEHDIDEADKALVDRKTMDMFVSGLKTLLPPGELAKFEAQEAHLKNDVIRPILLRGNATEMGDRMTVLLTHLQREGIAIPGPLMNFAQSQMRLNGAMTDLDALLAGVKALAKETRLYTVSGALDVVGGGITNMINHNTPLQGNSMKETIEAFEYNQNPTQQQLDQWALDSSRGPQEGEDPAAYQAIKDEATKNLKAYNTAQQAQRAANVLVLQGFGLPTDELWKNRPSKPEIGMSLEKLHQGQIGNYLKSPEQDPELFAKHQEFLAVKNQIDPKVYDEYVKAELTLYKDGGIVGNEPKQLQGEDLELHNQAVEIVRQFGQTELGKDLLRIRGEIVGEIKTRMAATGKEWVEAFPEGNKMNKPGTADLTPTTNLVTETLRTVNSNIGSMEQAKDFGSKLGMGKFDMIGMAMGYGEWYNYMSTTMEGLGKHATEEFENDLAK